MGAAQSAEEVAAELPPIDSNTGSSGLQVRQLNPHFHGHRHPSFLYCYSRNLRESVFSRLLRLKNRVPLSNGSRNPLMVL